MYLSNQSSDRKVVTPSNLIRIISTVGARLQFIKAATVSWAIAEYNRRCPGYTIVEKTIHTGQHYDENVSKVLCDEHLKLVD